MEWQQLIMDIYERMSQELESALNGLTVDDLNQQPHPDCNSIGWLVWHLTRCQDRFMQGLMEEEQLWVKDNWYTKFHRVPDPTDDGWGHRSEDVAAFMSPDNEVLLQYHHAVIEQSKRYISKLSEVELKRKLKYPAYPTTTTVRASLVGIINDNLQHVGQVAYMRGLLKGKGWLDR